MAAAQDLASQDYSECWGGNFYFSQKKSKKNQKKIQILPPYEEVLLPVLVIAAGPAGPAEPQVQRAGQGSARPRPRRRAQCARPRKGQFALFLSLSLPRLFLPRPPPSPGGSLPGCLD